MEMHCTAPDMPWRRPPEEMSPQERSEYGGPWMSIETLRSLYALYVERNSPILVAEDRSGRIVANIDLWLADEPEPVGRNAFVEIVQEHAEYVGSGLENAFLGYAADAARGLGYPALDGSFGIGGLGTDYFEKRALGFHIWDEHDRIEVACEGGRAPRLREVPASGDLVRDVCVLGRWAPTEFVWLVRVEDQGHRLEVDAAGARCFIAGLDAADVRGPEEPGRVLDTTLFVPGDRRHDAALVSELLRIYAAYGAANGYEVVRTFVPAEVTGKLVGLEVLASGYIGTCLRMPL